MTISTTLSRVTYLGDGSAVGFAVPFVFFGADEIGVIERDLASGAETPRNLASDYSVGGGGGQAGIVTAQLPPPTGTSWTIFRRTHRTQMVDYTPNDPFPAETHERALDRAMAVAQELDDAQARSLKLSPTTALSELALPHPQADRLLGWKSDLSGIENKDLPVGSAVYATIANALVGESESEAVTPAGLRAFAEAADRYNLLLNPGFRVAQRGGGPLVTGDGAYGLDQWYALCETAAIAVEQQALQANFMPTNIRLTQTQVAAQRIGLAQVLEHAHARQMRGRDIVLSAQIRCSAAQPIRYAVLGWSGGADSITRDVVNDWTSGAVSPGGFFLGANLTVIAAGVVTPAAAAWTELPAIGGHVPASVNNLYVVFWSGSALAQGATLDIGQAALQRGIPAWAPPPLDAAVDLMRCQRYFERVTTAGAQTALGAGFVDTSGTTSRSTIAYRPKRVVPTIALAGSIGIGTPGTDPTVDPVNVVFGKVTPGSAEIACSGLSLTAGNGILGYLTTSSHIDISAEL